MYPARANVEIATAICIHPNLGYPNSASSPFEKTIHPYNNTKAEQITANKW